MGNGLGVFWSKVNTASHQGGQLSKVAKHPGSPKWTCLTKTSELMGGMFHAGFSSHSGKGLARFNPTNHFLPIISANCGMDTTGFLLWIDFFGSGWEPQKTNSQSKGTNPFFTKTNPLAVWQLTPQVCRSATPTWALLYCSQMEDPPNLIAIGYWVGSLDFDLLVESKWFSKLNAQNTFCRGVSPVTKRMFDSN